MAKRKKSPVWVVVGLLIAVASWCLKNQEEGRNFQSSEVSSFQKTEETQAGRRTLGEYDILEGCRLSANRRNDGDSFFVKYAGGESEFRLYFADAPESKYKEYRGGDSNGKRLGQQGDYFGGLTRSQTTQLGMVAKNYVKKVLSKQPFKVMTRWEGVYGPERKYAFVIVQENGEERFLHEILVSKGMARIHTKPANLPDGTRASKQKRKLYKLESEAKKAGRGGWGM